jgi:hypothetical protein
MSQLPSKPYSRTVFIVEGVQTAVVVTAIGGRMSRRQRQFKSPEAALTWCRQHRASLVYSPAENPASN